MNRLCGLLVLLLGPLNGTAQDLPDVKVERNPEGALLVGQYLRLDICVQTEEILFKAPRFDLPEISGGVLLQSSTQAIRGTTLREGRTVQETRYAFAFFAHRPGDIEIPPITLRYPEDSQIAGILKTPPLRVESGLPAGAEGLTTLITTPRLEVKETWSPAPGEAQVGDAFTRTITMDADRMLGMGFPPLDFPALEGVGVYPESPRVRDTSYRGSLRGNRTEVVTYVMETEGTFLLPPIEIRWYDLSSEELKTEVLEAATLVVNPNPALQAAEDEASADPVPLLAVGAALLGSGGALFFFRHRLRRVLAERRIRHHASEPYAFRQLQLAIRREDPAVIYQRMLDWVARLPPCNGPPSITALTRIAPHSAFGQSVEELSSVLFGVDPGAEWTGGASLPSQLVEVRKAWLNPSQPGGSMARSLQPLNP